MSLITTGILCVAYFTTMVTESDPVEKPDDLYPF